MASDELVQQALRLLREAGHMDLVQESALDEMRLACRGGIVVVAAVWACSPPHQARSVGPVVRWGAAQECGEQPLSGPGKSGERAHSRRSPETARRERLGMSSPASREEVCAAHWQLSRASHRWAVRPCIPRLRDGAPWTPRAEAGKRRGGMT
ncbi:hypothetical protein NDU88_002921 [Pleurodeles waltl]|uniref:Uncharacterized protein n=1 Tax=Pleurodeles waltl TaxID=8319 RepID=A0AAV7Q7H7_PLEWA|nr:hypothetical protein NDU88_002921 [Pleurodeles waltl]